MCLAHRRRPAPVRAPALVDLRQSRSNRGSFRLHGVSGYVELSGDLARAWPWLAALAPRGAGQKRSFGLGEVRLWIPVSEE